MGETGLILPKAQNWHLRGTLLIIGIATWVFGIIVIVGYTYAFFNDLGDFYTQGSLYRATGQGQYIVTVLDMAIDSGFQGLCEFDIPPHKIPPNDTDAAADAAAATDADKKKKKIKTLERNRKLAEQAKLHSRDKATLPIVLENLPDTPTRGVGSSPTDQNADPDANVTSPPMPEAVPEYAPPTTEPLPTLVNQEGCTKSIEKETRWQRAELKKDAWRIFNKVEEPVQKVFLFLDVLMIVFGFLAGIIGYLLVRGGVWKRRKLLLPWLLMSFTIAYGAVFYGVMYMTMRSGFSPDKMVTVGAVAAAAVIVVVLHAMAFIGVAKYCAYLWRRESTPDYPIRRMGLVLART